MPTTSRTLLERVRDPRDEEAWERFFSIYAPLLRGYAASRGLSDADADEVRDQCLGVIARRMPAFRYDPRRGAFKAWLYRIASGKVVDRLRASAALRPPPDPFLLDDVCSSEPAPDEAWERAWRDQHLRYALEEVRTQVGAETYRTFEMLLIEGATVKDVCARTGATPNLVYKARARVLARVRDALARIGVDPPGGCV